MESWVRQLANQVVTTYSYLVQAVFPASCYNCQRPDFSLCPSCENIVLSSARGDIFSLNSPDSSAITLAWSAGRYADQTWRNLLHAWKYGGVSEAGELVCELFARALQQPAHQSYFSEPGLIIPVPLHPWRRAWRGFDQAELLAMSASIALNLPIIKPLSRRHRWRTQASLGSSTARQKNAARAYVVRQPALVRGQRIILIDDVCTSGSTAIACAKLLLQAGAISVSLITFLRK